MPGIRIQPTKAAMQQVGLVSAANREWIVRDVSRPLQGPPFPECSRCGHHDVKTYHLQLDGDGTVMVNIGVWDRLQKLFDNGGFEKVNDVEEPPVQQLLMPPAKVELHPGDF